MSFNGLKSTLKIYVVPLAITLLLVELVYSYAYIVGLIHPQSLWFVERSDPNGHFKFDSEIGYRVSPIRTRLGVYSTRHGVVSLGNLKGNNLGFLAGRDFFPKKKSPDTHRVAVFGDSYSAAPYLFKNWTERLEEKLKRDGYKIEVYNFSISGGGLGNWWSTIDMLAAENFEIDTAIFAVFDGDLARPFVWWDDTGNYEENLVAVGYHPDFNFKEFPNEVENFEESLAPRFRVLSTADFEKLLRGELSLYPHREYQFYFLRHLKWAIEGRTFPSSYPHLSKADPRVGFDNPRKLHMAKEIRTNLESMHAKTLVLDFSKFSFETKDFAEVVDADLASLKAFFAELPDFELDSIRIPEDGHFNVEGDRLIAKFVGSWLRENVLLESGSEVAEASAN